MGQRITSVDCLSGELTISDDGIAWLNRDDFDLDGPDGRLPESAPEARHDGERYVVDMHWTGEGSATAIDCGALRKFFSLTRGTAEFVFTWNGGDFCTGYRVVDGVMTEHEVEFKLGKEVGK